MYLSLGCWIRYAGTVKQSLYVETLPICMEAPAAMKKVAPLAILTCMLSTVSKQLKIVVGAFLPLLIS